MASCSSFFFMYSHALSTGIVVNSDRTSKETKTSLSSILISDNTLENYKELATEYPLRF